MGFKQSGFPMHKGTNSHSSALKMQQEQNAVAKLRAEQLKTAHSNPTRTNLDPYAENQPSPGKMMESGTAKQGSSPNKIWPLVAALGASFIPAIGRALFSSSAKKALTTTVGKTISSTGGKEMFKQAGKGGIISKIGSFGKGMFTWPALASGAVGMHYGSKSGTAGERERLGELGGKIGKAGGAWASVKRKATDSRKYTQAKSRNPKLDALIKQRRGATKGTSQYNAIQNQINIAYGDPTRHGQTKSISTKRRKTTRTTDTPGVSTKVVTGKKRISGKLKKRVTDIDRVEGMGRDRRMVEKFRKSGARKKTVEKYDTGQAIAGGQLGKKKVKTKYTRSGDVKKTITVEGGKRTVRDAQGNIIKSRKTLNPFD